VTLCLPAWLQSLPESISCLVELKALSLALNKLEGELSPALGGCTSLRLLDVSGNQITVRPEALPGPGWYQNHVVTTTA
jgi:Leucine-rich repeat (LRR) protein